MTTKKKATKRTEPDVVSADPPTPIDPEPAPAPPEKKQRFSNRDKFGRPLTTGVEIVYIREKSSRAERGTVVDATSKQGFVSIQLEQAVPGVEYEDKDLSGRPAPFMVATGLLHRPR
jgi:hypothetical protein